MQIQYVKANKSLSMKVLYLFADVDLLLLLPIHIIPSMYIKQGKKGFWELYISIHSTWTRCQLSLLSHILGIGRKTKREYSCTLELRLAMGWTFRVISAALLLVPALLLM